MTGPIIIHLNQKNSLRNILLSGGTTVMTLTIDCRSKHLFNFWLWDERV